MTEDELREFRRELHRYPEVSTREVETSRRLMEKLSLMDHDGLEKVGGTGLAIYFKGTGNGHRILLRGDIDALPIQEVNTFEHRSENPGVSHKCGHDGHATILLGVAARLAEQRPSRGEVCLVFQPAEENGKGAKAILEDPAFNFKADKAFALHNLPGYPMHKVVCRKGSFTAAAKSVILKLSGKTSHAAEPHKGINPGLAMAEILQLSEELSEKDTRKDDFKLVTLVHAILGEKAYGISAGYGEVHLTLRTWNNQVMQQLESALLQKVDQLCKPYELSWEQEWLEVFFANENEEEAFELVRKVAGAQNLSFEAKDRPFTWGEDFGLFTQKYGGAMFGIGAGEETPALHNPDYDYPDAITTTGIDMFCGIIERAV